MQFQSMLPKNAKTRPSVLPVKLALVVLALWFAGGCANGAQNARGRQRYQFAQMLMGVQVRLIVYADNEAIAKAGCKAAFERVAQLEDIMTDYRPDSELMRLCARAGTGPVQVSCELFYVLSYGQKIAQASNGDFDMTVGPYVRLWRTARKTHTLPTPEQLARARQRVGYQLMKLDPTSRTVDLLVPGMQLDLGGIGKGYAGDEAIKVLREHGITSALFEAGGDIVVSDPPPDKPRGWTIQTIDTGAGKETLHLHDCAVSTSGDTEQYVEINGVRYSHVVNPHTGIGLTKRMMATVVAPMGITSDALSKPVTMLEPQKAEALCKEFAATCYVRRVD
jgi:thiamine biosynthesis lipoprotein